MNFAKIAGIGMVAVSLGLYGCASTGDGTWLSNANLGTAIGAAAGGLLGSQVGKGAGRTAAVVAGIAGGGLLGRMAGARLDEREQRSLDQQMQTVLNETPDGQQTVWASEHGDTNVRIMPTATEVESRPVVMKHTSKVQLTDNMSLLNTPYQTVKPVNIRSAPDVNSERVGGLPAGAVFTAVGRTENDWIAVSRHGVMIGYIHVSLVQVAPGRQTQNPSVDLDNIETASFSSHGVDLNAIDLDAMAVPQQITAQVKCRTVNYDASVDGSREQQSMKACQTPDNTWEVS